MSISGTYNWLIEAIDDEKYRLTAHGILVGEYASESEAEAYIRNVIKRDTIERRAGQWTKIQLSRWANQWAMEFDLPRNEVWEDIQAGVTAMLADQEQ